MNPEMLTDINATRTEISFGSLGNRRPKCEIYRNAPNVFNEKYHFVLVIPC